MKKQELDFDLTLKYFVEQLNSGNVLSQYLVEHVHFDQGGFYTLLPEDPPEKNLYDFQSGGILSQNPIEEYYIDGKRATYSIIPTMHNEVSEFIFEKLIKYKNLSCMFEELLDSPNSPQLRFFREKNLLYLVDNEVYYLLKEENIKLDLILTCLKKSNAIWHSLLVLTKADFANIINKELNLQKIKEICSFSELIGVGAYDGEGYIFWEKS